VPSHKWTKSPMSSTRSPSADRFHLEVESGRGLDDLHRRRRQVARKHVHIEELPRKQAAPVFLRCVSTTVSRQLSEVLRACRFTNRHSRS
jgi:hypothetical protein